MTNEELLEMSILVRDLTEINKNLKKQIAINEMKISRLNMELNKYQFQLKKNGTELAIKVLEQEPCEDEEYEKDLNGLKEQIFKEGNTLISKQDLLERFIEIDNEYKNSHWNLLQILSNIDILIGKEPCEDAVSRQAVKEQMIKYGFHALDITITEFVADLPPVNPQKIGHWIDMGSGQECSECREIQYGYDSFRYFCANCGAKMIEPQESKDNE